MRVIIIINNNTSTNYRQLKNVKIHCQLQRIIANFPINEAIQPNLWKSF